MDNPIDQGPVASEEAYRLFHIEGSRKRMRERGPSHWFAAQAKGVVYLYLQQQAVPQTIDEIMHAWPWGVSRPTLGDLTVLLEQGIAERRIAMLPEGTYILRGKRPRTGLRPSQRFRIFKRDGYRCQLCGRSREQHGVVLEVDHILARANGGCDDDDNLHTTCFDCNRGKRTQNL